MTKRLEELLKKRDQLNSQIQKIKAIESLQKRKEDTRRKILLGALMMDLIQVGEIDKTVIEQRLDKFLTRDIDRQLFDLPPRGSR